MSLYPKDVSNYFFKVFLIKTIPPKILYLPKILRAENPTC